MNKKLLIAIGVLSMTAICLFVFILLDRKVVIYFDTDGGNFVESITIRKGSIFRLEEKPTKEGFIFAEWYLDGKPLEPNKRVNENMTLLATWKEIIPKEKPEGEDKTEGEEATKDDETTKTTEPSESASKPTEKPSESKKEEEKSSSGGGLIGKIGIDWGGIGKIIKPTNCGWTGTYNPVTKLCERTLVEDAVIYACTYPMVLMNGRCYHSTPSLIQCTNGALYTLEDGGGCSKSPGITPDYQPNCPYPHAYFRGYGTPDHKKCYLKIEATNEADCESKGGMYTRLYRNGELNLSLECIHLGSTQPVLPCKTPKPGERLIHWIKCNYEMFESPPVNYNCPKNTIKKDNTCYKDETNDPRWPKYKCTKPGYKLDGKKCSKVETYEPY